MSRGTGVIWHGFPFETPVIPTKAGTGLWKCTADGLDSRHRGNDCALSTHGWQMTPAPQSNS